MKKQMFEITKLKVNPKNPRIIKDEKFKKLCKSIQDFPEMMSLRPIIYDENKIILGGNMRFKALQHLGMKRVPADWVKSANELNEEQKKEFVIKDNNSFGEYDYDLLANEWDALPLEEWGIDLPEIDIEQEAKEDDYVMHDKIETDIVLGDIIEIGQHRLMCGDSTDSDAVAKLMNGEIGVLMNTDPPYGVDYVKLAKSKGQQKLSKNIVNDELSNEGLQEFLEEVIRSAVPFLIERCAFYLWHPMLTQGTFFAAAAAANIIINSQIIWVKPSLVFGRNHYHWMHELCFYGWRKGHKPDFYGESNQTTVWKVGRENDKIHPTQKPIELFSIPIKNHTLKNQVVYEPFGGSGSQFVAAHQLNRKCYGMEIDPEYCQVIVDRMKLLDASLEVKINGKVIS